MVPRPEDQKTYPERRAAPEPGEIYSNSSDDDCAKLVKAGQLDTFSKPRKIAHQDLTDLHGSKSIKDPPRGRSEQRPILTERRNARSSSRDTIRVGDRVIVKEKYIGTCRYVGPIEEKYILPEIFIGVELDEPLTNNSGVFGSRQYFDCDHGFGLMVSSTKVRKIRDLAFSDNIRTRFRKSGIKSAKSYTDLTAEKNSSSLKYRVSQGYKNLDQNGKSRTLINQNLNSFENHPMSTLNNIKRFQEYGIYPNEPVPSRSEVYSLPLQHRSTSHTFPFPAGDMLRESFRRIVAPSSYRSYVPEFDQNLYRNASMPHIYHPGSIQGSVPNDLWRTRSMPNNSIPNSVRMPPTDRRISTGSGYSSNGSIEPSYLSSVPPSAPYYYKYQNPLCQSCAACSTCYPTQISKLSGNTVPNFTPQVYRSTKVSTGSDDSPVLSDQSGYTKSSYHTLPARNPQGLLKSSENRFLKSLSNSTKHSTMESIEYEKWKANYGKTVGRGMKKGLNKLTSALLYA